MNDNETKLVPPEALKDDALDKVVGGDGELISTTPQGVAPFVKDNCYSCRHFENYNTDCPYGNPAGAMLKLGGASRCPSKEA